MLEFKRIGNCSRSKEPGEIRDLLEFDGSKLSIRPDANVSALTSWHLEVQDSANSKVVRIRTADDCEHSALYLSVDADDEVDVVDAHKAPPGTLQLWHVRQTPEEEPSLFRFQLVDPKRSNPYLQVNDQGEICIGAEASGGEVARRQVWKIDAGFKEKS